MTNVYREKILLSFYKKAFYKKIAFIKKNKKRTSSKKNTYEKYEKIIDRFYMP